MQDLIRYLEDYLSTEELCNLYVGEKPTDQQSSRYAATSKNSVTSRKRTVSASCMYCKGEHPAFACTVFPTPQARSRYLRENQLCFLCASSAHKTLQCTRRPCFFCKAAHHSSCCFNRQKREAEPIKKPDTSSATKKPSEKGKKLNKVAASVNSNQVSNVTDQETSSANIDGHDTVLQLQAMTQVQQTNRSALPTGEITVLDPTTKGLRKVDVLFDSGAEVSFINASLANELCLPVIREESIRIHTFGSKDVQQATCKLVKLDVWDAEGNVHTFYLRTHNVLTQVFPTPRIPDADRQEILDRKLSVQHLDTDKVIINPLILLGCDQMWSLFRMDLTPISLSSGLVLIPTKLGYVVSGQSKTVPQEKTNEILQVSSYNEDLERWNNYWSMEVQMNTIQYGDPQRITYAMAQGDEYLNSFRALASVYQERVSVEDIEIDMTTTLGEINNHIKRANTLDSQLTHHQLTTTEAKFTGGELILATSRLWKTATYAKEKLHSLTQRYMLFDAVYRLKVEVGKIPARRRVDWQEDDDHDIKRISLMVQIELKRLDRNISDIEYEMARAEKIVQDEKVQNKTQFVSVFNKTIDKLEQRLDDIALKLTINPDGQEIVHPTKRKLDQELEEVPSASKIQAIEDISSTSKNVPNTRKLQKSEDAPSTSKDVPSTSKIKTISDDEYMERLIEESKDQEEEDDNKEDSPPEVADRKQEQERNRQQEQERERKQARRDQARRQEQEREREQARRHQGRRENERRRYIEDLERELKELCDGRAKLARRKIGDNPNVLEHTQLERTGYGKDNECRRGTTSSHSPITRRPECSENATLYIRLILANITEDVAFSAATAVYKLGNEQLILVLVSVPKRRFSTILAGLLIAFHHQYAYQYSAAACKKLFGSIKKS
ncbi:hypothetical protein GCK32_010865 [Trichostrongylus colubriformis]|uniref:DUF1758 domain-containing protein n=1 Tax=Trichostrongylus colubriformis TaxID=6319 RepID=A0AAN8G0D1_TRICO